MTTRLDNIRPKVERANEHIREFEAALNAFRDSNPYRLVREQGPNNLDHIFKVHIVSTPPLHLSLIAGDAIHNFRCALDHLAWQLVESFGNTPGRHTSFPIYDSHSGYETNSKNNVQGIDPRAISVIDGIQPYKGGNDEIWKLHRLDIIDKHRLLYVIGYGRTNANLRLGNSSPQAATLGFSIDFMPLRNGAELGRIQGIVDPKMHMNLDLDFDIAFDQPRIVQGEHVLPFLRQLSDLVDKIILQFASFL